MGLLHGVPLGKKPPIHCEKDFGAFRNEQKNRIKPKKVVDFCIGINVF
jgi:hypothetical protein